MSAYLQNYLLPRNGTEEILIHQSYRTAGEKDEAPRDTYRLCPSAKKWQLAVKPLQGSGPSSEQLRLEQRATCGSRCCTRRDAAWLLMRVQFLLGYGLFRNEITETDVQHRECTKKEHWVARWKRVTSLSIKLSPTTGDPRPTSQGCWEGHMSQSLCSPRHVPGPAATLWTLLKVVAALSPCVPRFPGHEGKDTNW